MTAKEAHETALQHQRSKDELRVRALDCIAQSAKEGYFSALLQVETKDLYSWLSSELRDLGYRVDQKRYEQRPDLIVMEISW